MKNIKQISTKNNLKFSCVLCDEKFNTERELYKHLANYHTEFVVKVIALFEDSNDIGYMLSCLKCEYDNSLSESYWNS